MDSLPGNTKNQKSTRSWLIRVRFLHPWAVCISHLQMIPIVQFLWTKIFMHDWSPYALSFIRTLWTKYCKCELPDSGMLRASGQLWPYGQDTE